jgi:hypothetical protein
MQSFGFTIGGLAAYTIGFRASVLKLKAARAVTGSFTNPLIAKVTIGYLGDQN